jgi:hypothetical protein
MEAGLPPCPNFIYFIIHKWCPQNSPSSFSSVCGRHVSSCVRELYTWCSERATAQPYNCGLDKVFSGYQGRSTLMMMTEMDIETAVYYVHLTRLIAREDFIKFTRRESTKTYITTVELWCELWNIKVNDGNTQEAVCFSRRHRFPEDNLQENGRNILFVHSLKCLCYLRLEDYTENSYWKDRSQGLGHVHTSIFPI